jgi:hypothetical protein
MSFNKKYLPDPEKLIKIRESYSSDKEFLEDYFRKTDAILGSPESFEYIQKIRQRVKEDEQRMGKGS